LKESTASRQIPAPTIIKGDEQMDLKKLAEPFKPKDIEWRVQQAGGFGENPWALVLAYVTNRAIMQRLDDVCGIENWKNEFKSAPDGGVMCGLSVKVVRKPTGDIDPMSYSEWVTKWDGAENTNVEAVKGRFKQLYETRGCSVGNREIFI
jgi:hypothetical protein